MVEVKLGAATVRRIEESYEPNFDAKVFFPDWQPDVAHQHREWLQGLAQMIDGAAELDEHLEVEPAPGHTPGTIAIKFESRGEKGLFCGDILHHALQVYHPEWNSFACAEAVGARKSRLAALEHCAGSGARLMPCHFGAPFTCHIDHKGSGFAPRFDGQY
jgi:glyoxylase-like metal-dependent hydrolase (beta-lactamase superfamily II)